MKIGACAAALLCLVAAAACLAIAPLPAGATRLAEEAPEELEAPPPPPAGCAQTIGSLKGDWLTVVVAPLMKIGASEPVGTSG